MKMLVLQQLSSLEQNMVCTVCGNVVVGWSKMTGTGQCYTRATARMESSTGMESGMVFSTRMGMYPSSPIQDKYQ